MHKFLNLRRLSFSLSGVLLLLLMVATIAEQIIGTKATIEKIYTSPITIALWIATVCCSLAYLFQRKVQKNIITFLIHFSFVVILLGALVTHIFGQQGKVRLRLNESENMYLDSDDLVRTFPFAMELNDFHLEYYRGTRSPMDFVSKIKIIDGREETFGTVSMNNVFVYRNYRFYQLSYDANMQGVSFAVSYDPYGIAITYVGYALLFFSFFAFFWQKNTMFRQLLKKRSLLLFFAIAMPFFVKATPRTLQPALADKFTQLHVYYNDRVCPLSTLANDFCQKIYGKTSYQGFSAEQVLVGWLFYYDDWKTEPMIKIKGEDVRKQLGIKGKYACLNDFVDYRGYKLEKLLRERMDKNVQSADEKFNLIAMISTGSLFRVFPYKNTGNELFWYSWTDRLPADIPLENWQMIKGSMSFVMQEIEHGRFASAADGLERIGEYQKVEAGEENLPSEIRFVAEQIYNHLHVTKPLAFVCLTLGLLLFAVYIYCFSMERKPNRIVSYFSVGVLSAVLVFLTLLIVLRGFVSGHLPLSNGFETMQFLAWTSLLLSLLFNKKIPLLLPFGLLLCGLSLLVAMMGEANPKITNLMPVLSSPLLSIHVMIIMLSYALLAFVMLNGLTAVFLHLFSKNSDMQIVHLKTVSQLMLYPAVFCLAIGIFVGAIWANLTWGRYWGWDPKEVWALITLMIYSLALHTDSLPMFRKPMFFHLFAVVAFLAVLFTYFGVNFLLGGLHSYV